MDHSAFVFFSSASQTSFHFLSLFNTFIFFFLFAIFWKFFLLLLLLLSGFSPSQVKQDLFSFFPSFLLHHITSQTDEEKEEDETRGEKITFLFFLLLLQHFYCCYYCLTFLTLSTFIRRVLIHLFSIRILTFHN